MKIPAGDDLFGLVAGERKLIRFVDGESGHAEINLRQQSLRSAGGSPAVAVRRRRKSADFRILQIGHDGLLIDILDRRPADEAVGSLGGGLQLQRHIAEYIHEGVVIICAEELRLPNHRLLDGVVHGDIGHVGNDEVRRLYALVCCREPLLQQRAGRVLPQAVHIREIITFGHGPKLACDQLQHGVRIVPAAAGEGRVQEIVDTVDSRLRILLRLVILICCNDGLR